MSEPLLEATEHQPGARTALGAALAAPGHAYLFSGPPGAGKAAAARAFAAELLAEEAADPENARRRALADPSPHPDLTWIRPPGNQHLVEEIRSRLIAAAAYRPFEASRRVFVVEAAEAMAEESQNALLKTLEEPAADVHILLLTAEPAALLDTVRSRCQAVRFNALPAAAVEAQLARTHPEVEAPTRRAAARLAGGNTALAEDLLVPPGSELRDAAAKLVEAAADGDLGDSPWAALISLAEEAGEGAARRAQVSVLAQAEAAGASGADAKRATKQAEDAAKRAGRQARTAALDLALALVGSWLRDIVAVASGAEGLALNCDGVDRLRARAELDPRRARRAGELVMDTRRRLQVNVGEELALEALSYRLEALLSA